MPLRITRVIGNRFLPESCDDVHTHFKRNWYELAGQPGVAISTARRNCDAGFCGERSADSRVQRELEFAVQYARTRLSALRSLRSTPVRRELEGLEGFHENELG